MPSGLAPLRGFSPRAANRFATLLLAKIVAIVAIVAMSACRSELPADSAALAPADTGDDAPTVEVDVLIIGAGPAGLAAALEALDHGATVRILEREATHGGSLNFAGGDMLFSGSVEQGAAGISDSPEQLLGEWAEITGGDTSDPWVQLFAQQNVPMVHDWLVALGVGWNEVVTDPSAGRVARIHKIEGLGRALADAMYDALPVDTVDFRAEAKELLLRGDGNVQGVRWRDLDAEAEREMFARTVIVATGGFMHDLERVRREVPEIAAYDLRWGSWEGADGNGLALLEAHGAATQNLGAVGLYAHGAPAPTANDGAYFDGGIGDLMWFNNQGARFCDESLTNSLEVGWTRANQPDGESWFLFDAGRAFGATFAVFGGATLSLGEMREAGLVAEADSVSGVASALGVDSATLDAEWQAFNTFARGETTEDAFRDSAEPPPALESPPFYALPVAITVAKGFGGIDVDLAGRVFDVSGATIPGLYAAGELTGMAGGSLVGRYGFTGSLTAVVLGGRVAGAAAAEEARTSAD